MVMRIHNTARWNRVKAGTALVVSGPLGGSVRIEVNTPVPTLFEVVEGERVTLLGAVYGLEVLDFYCSGPGELVASTDSDWWYALAGDGEMIVESDPSFVRIMQRKARNHDLEMIQYKLEENARRRESKQAAEVAVLTARLAALQAAQAAGEGGDPETGEVDDGNDPAATGAVAGGEPPQQVAEATPGKRAGKGAADSGTASA